MMGVLDNKTALVTGAGQGVGQGIAFALAGEGAKVMVTGRTEAKLHATCEEIVSRGGAAMPMACDVLDGEQIAACTAAAANAFDGNGIDILVNNAQIVTLGTLLEVGEDGYRHCMDSGPLATFRLMNSCFAQLKKNKGSIVNLASSSALRWDMQGYGVYAAAKEAIRSLTRAAAHEWAQHGIRANCILPLALSPGMEWWQKNNPEESTAFLKTVPLKRIGDCEKDIGRAVVFLCSPDASYITAHSLMLDGGQARLG